VYSLAEEAELQNGKRLKLFRRLRPSSCVEVVLAVARRLRGSWVRMATAWCPGCWWWRSWRCRLRTKRSSGWGPGRCL